MKIIRIILLLLLTCSGTALARVEDRSRELFDAAGSNNLTLIKEILGEPFYDTNVPYGDEDLTPLMAACKKGYTEAAKLLLEHEANPDALSARGATALMMASYEGHTGCVKLLLNKKAKINLKDNAGDTALHNAVRSRNYDIARLLIESGADINAKNNNGVTPLMHAVSGNMDFIKYMAGKGADIAAVDKKGRTIPEYADSPNAREIRKYLTATADEKKIKMPVSWMKVVFRDDMGYNPYTHEYYSNKPYMYVSASSYLPDNKEPIGMYSPRNLFDGKKDRVWAVKGGIGEHVWFEIGENTGTIGLVNGLAKSKNLFLANNRVKKANLSVWAGFSLEGDISENASMRRAARLTPESALEIKDTMDAQNVALPFNWGDIRKSMAEARANFTGRPEFKEREISKEGYLLLFEIADIYKGSKYDDTCISEIDMPSVPVSEASLSGNWKAVKGSDVKQIPITDIAARLGIADADKVFFTIKGSVKSYSSFLHERPFQSGRWEIKNGELYIYPESGRSDKSVVYSGAIKWGGCEILTLTGTGGSAMVYERD